MSCCQCACALLPWAESLDIYIASRQASMYLGGGGSSGVM